MAEVQSIRLVYRCGETWFRVIFPWHEAMIGVVKSIMVPHRHRDEIERCWKVRNGYGYLDRIAKMGLMYFHVVQAEITQKNGETEITNMRTGEVMTQGDLFSAGGASGEG